MSEKKMHRGMSRVNFSLQFGAIHLLEMSCGLHIECKIIGSNLHDLFNVSIKENRSL